MGTVLDRCCRAIDFLIALALAVMVVLVFGNVVLRYVFNTGIMVSEELSRWLFVWLVFLGAIVALREGAHLGSDMLVSRLPPSGKKLCLVLGHLVMLYITWLIFSGSWTQVQINARIWAPVTGASMGVFYAAGMVFAIASALVLSVSLWRLLTGQLSDRELIMVRESEEEVELEQINKELAHAESRTKTEQRNAS
jgi:TRAP-type C4-dicarboxylate transport system permease small subunit